MIVRQRTDPLVPVLASSVAFVVLGAVVLVFYPRISDLVGPERDSVVGTSPAPDVQIPIWVCNPEEGVALMLAPLVDAKGLKALNPAFEVGARHFLRLSVHNFAGPDPYRMRLPETGLSSPGGGAPARPATALLRKDVEPYLRTVLQALGAVDLLEVGRGRCGQALLVLPDSPENRSAFVSGTLRFLRRKVERYALESWRQRPDYEKFKDF